MILPVVILLSFLLSVSPWFSAPYAEHHMDTSSSVYQTRLEENLALWGLGNHFKTYVTNDRPYAWYIDQGETGSHSGSNCGPTSVAMAAKWVKPQSRVTPQRARFHYRPFGGWWYSDDIAGSLSRFDVLYYQVSLEDEKTLMGLLGMGHLLLVNNTMGGISRNHEESQRTGRFYDFASGHYFLIKGFVQTDQGLYFEVYDPNSWSQTYSDGMLKGQNRYYESGELVDSILKWYPELIVIPSRSN